MKGRHPGTSAGYPEESWLQERSGRGVERLKSGDWSCREGNNLHPAKKLRKRMYVVLLLGGQSGRTVEREQVCVCVCFT